MKNKKWLLIFLALFAVFIFCICLVVVGWYFFLKPDKSVTSEILDDHIVITLDSAPPTYLKDFPTTEVPYPPNWPEELILPEEFTLVEAISGNLPDNPNPAWGLKEIYDGSPMEAKELILPFFLEQGWDIVQSFTYEPYGYVFILDKNNGGSGIMSLESDGENIEKSILVITIIQPNSKE